MLQSSASRSWMMGVILGAGVAVVLIATTILIVHRRLQERSVAIHIFLCWNLKAKDKKETKNADHCKTVLAH
ncbi:hypothetical protein scyTo_0014768 [Scyliorhinus torazame]|uniref:Uncharacterized protein n=1 Tax=Scyliorhinus torazame TaxID=75743 RepID=A0A401NUC6_SCYTO|nr:hypothetical protein [Scyliorhinus torazame]